MDYEITKREVLFSVVIVCVMMLFGFIISDNINNSIMAKNNEYNTALQINADKSLFEYGMRTNIGNAFVYGDLVAVDPVTYSDVGGEYSYIKKVKEKYTMHTRVVTTTVNGKTKTETKTYWTWDEVDSEYKQSTQIKFIDVEFNYGVISFPQPEHVYTTKESNNIRYKYYGSPAKCTGTIYTKLENNTVKDAHFYNHSTIEETLENLKSGWELILFWVIWILLTIGIIVGFYFIDNRWLED